MAAEHASGTWRKMGDLREAGEMIWLVYRNLAFLIFAIATLVSNCSYLHWCLGDSGYG